MTRLEEIEARLAKDRELLSRTRDPVPDFMYDIAFLIERVKAARAEAIEAIIEYASTPEPCGREIPCPDGIEGCLVSHSVQGTRPRTHHEIIAYAQSLKGT